MRVLFAILLIIHMLIHILGFAWSRLYASEFAQVPATQSLLWFLATVLISVTTILFIRKKPTWVLLAIPALITSQLLIYLNWDAAKYGSILNLIILLVIIISIAGWKFEKSFKKDKIDAIIANSVSGKIISEADIAMLPLPVKKYLKYSGFLDKPEIENFEIRFSGQMREKNKNWFSFTTEQLNTIDPPGRYFFMKANYKGVSTQGYHKYDGKTARMLIKPLSIFKVIDISSRKLLKSEMVTYLNDVCIFAPGALINDKFSFENMGNHTVKVTYTYAEISISAVMEFGEEGQLINFFSNDRYDLGEKKKFLFSTPVGGYKSFNGYNLPSYGETIWHYPDADFVYGKFNALEVNFNIDRKINNS
ncbi:hypothetical protein ML462_14855 [Gramella lutea]|uniref:Uncharacterized protein n=1 Tax=Christiangramia lutea TaxID=1607951 RepID=A0A9X1V5Y2_9FLAO|nr:DUF6544 family protein [Christiangramia lutea]MCH4824450.1 hypothetical protein [Christiangramia lutea]